MGTAEDDLVDAGGEQRGEMLARFLDKIGILEAQALHSRGPPRAGLHVDPYRSGMLPDKLRQALAARRRGRGEHGDPAAA